MKPMKTASKSFFIMLLVAAGATALLGQTVKVTNTNMKTPKCYTNCMPPPSSVPEPGSYMLMGGGLAALALVRKKIGK
jgi:hypothetical protein